MVIPEQSQVLKAFLALHFDQVRSLVRELRVQLSLLGLQTLDLGDEVLAFRLDRGDFGQPEPLGERARAAIETTPADPTPRVDTPEGHPIQANCESSAIVSARRRLPRR